LIVQKEEEEGLIIALILKLSERREERK